MLSGGGCAGDRDADADRATGDRFVAPPEVDETLTAHPGSWPGSGLTFSYQWLDCDPADPTSCAPIDHATSATYKVDPADGGYELEVQVTAKDGSGDSGVATSAPTAVVVAQPGAPVLQTAPTTGTVTGGVSATATDGSWSPVPDSFTSEWLSCTPDLIDCNVVGNPDGLTYTPTAADVGHVLVFDVVATKAGLDSVETFSAPSNVVAFPPPTVTISTPAEPGPDAIKGVGFLLAQYACTPPAGMTLTSCVGTVPNGSPWYLPISFSLSRIFTVTATDADGQSTTKSVTVTLPAPISPLLPPTIDASAPVQNQSVVQGTPLTATFSCPGATACSAAQSATAGSPAAVASGGALDTATLGAHTLAITASSPGGTTTTSVGYTVFGLAAGALAQSSSTWRGGHAPPAVGGLTAQGRPLGTRFTLTLNAPAVVSFEFAHGVAGRMRAGHCVAPADANRQARRCTRSVVAGSFSEPLPAGASTVGFDAALSAASRLGPGRYTVALTAQAGNTGAVYGPVAALGVLHFMIRR